MITSFAFATKTNQDVTKTMTTDFTVKTSHAARGRSHSVVFSVMLMAKVVMMK